MIALSIESDKNKDLRFINTFYRLTLAVSIWVRVGFRLEIDRPVGSVAVKTVANILNAKPNKTVYTVTPNTSVYNAIKVMAEQVIGAIVVAENNRVLGMFTERDYARKIILQERSSKRTAVGDIMTNAIFYVCLTDTTEYCMALMTERRFRHLPVIDKERLVGLISIGDLVKDIIGEQKFIINELERYITGAGR